MVFLQGWYPTKDHPANPDRFFPVKKDSPSRKILTISMQMHEHATRYRAVLLPAKSENTGRPTVEKSRPQLHNLWPWKELSRLRVTTTVSAPPWRSRWFGVQFVALCVSILRIYTRLCRELKAGRNKERRSERRIRAKKRRKKKKK